MAKNGIVKTTRGGNNAKAIKVQGKWIQSKELIQFLAHLKHLLLQNLKNKPFKYYNYGK